MEILASTARELTELASRKIIPHSLEELLAANDKVFAQQRGKCSVCGQTPPRIGCCEGCGHVPYCGKVSPAKVQRKKH